MSEPLTEDVLNEIFPEIKGCHRVVIDEGEFGEENDRTKWFISLIEEELPCLFIAKVEEIRFSANRTRREQAVVLTEEEWRKIGEFKGWIK